MKPVNGKWPSMAFQLQCHFRSRPVGIRAIWEQSSVCWDGAGNYPVGTHGTFEDLYKTDCNMVNL